MKKFLTIIIFLLLGIVAFSQTTIPPASTWTPARNIINANFVNTYDSIAANRLRVNILNDSILAYATAINLRLLKSDTASMLTNYTRNGELNSALAAKVNVSDTAAMLDPYAKLTDLSEGGIGIGAVQDEIADSLNVLRAAVTVGNGTKAPYFDGSQDGGQILYFYGDNGFYTALQGGAPVANRSYRLPIAALPFAGTTSLMNIDEYGNMGFVASTTYAPLNAPQFTGVPRISTDTIATKAYARSVGGGDVSALETRVDSIVDVLADTANIEAILLVDLDTDTLATKAYARSVGGGSTAGITLNSGTLTLNGDESTADDITFYTNGDGSYDLPAGGGNLTIMSQVQGWINDSLDVFRPLYLEVADTASMLTNYALLSEVAASYVTETNLTDSLDLIREMIIDSLLLRSEPIFVFGAGGGNPGDTATFSGSGFPVLGSFNTGRDTLMITQVVGQLWDINTTDTLAIQIMYADSLNQTSFTTVWSSATGINADGLNSTSFASPKIPPRKWIWSRVASAIVGRKPTMINVQVNGYRIKAY
jgi:hypothetical protein